MHPTVLVLDRQLVRCKISIEELERALDALAAKSTCIEAVFPKVVRLDTDDQMLGALLCAITDRN